ncbi:MAG: hypothetical protein ACXABY_07965 [Candidatus Thorarchaeota archaeon]
MPTRTCAKCHLALYPKKNGAYLVVMAYHPPRPYKIYTCDIWACTRCHMEVAAGFSKTCIEHYEDEFAESWRLIKNKPYNIIIYQYENIEDAERYGDNPPDIPVGIEHAPPITITTIEKDDNDG